MTNSSVINSSVQSALFEPEPPAFPSEDVGKAIVNPASLPAILNKIKASPIVAVDTETTGLDIMRDILHGVSFATKNEDWYITGLSALQPAGRTSELDRRSRAGVGGAQHSKFDLHFLVKHGFRRTRIADTMIAKWLCDENMGTGAQVPGSHPGGLRGTA